MSTFICSTSKHFHFFKEFGGLCLQKTLRMDKSHLWGKWVWNKRWIASELKILLFTKQLKFKSFSFLLNSLWTCSSLNPRVCSLRLRGHIQLLDFEENRLQWKQILALLVTFCHSFVGFLHLRDLTWVFCYFILFFYLWRYTKSRGIKRFTFPPKRTHKKKRW